MLAPACLFTALGLATGGAQAQTPPALAGALDDIDGEGIAFIEWALDRDSFLIGEAFLSRLRFGLETAFLDENLLQLFQRPLDVPVQIHAPGLTELDGARAREREEVAGTRVALGEEIVTARPLGDDRRAGRTYRVFELTRAFVAFRPGEIVLGAPRLRFAFATRFEDDFLQGRRPLDRRDAEVQGRSVALGILPLPEEGRPSGFSGAIGRFSVHALAEPLELEAGEALTLILRMDARGELADLAHCEPPRLDDLRGFRVRGSLVEREPRRLTARYELVVEGPEVREVPSIDFVSFDTTPPAGYHTERTAPIPISVLPSGGTHRGAAPPELHSGPRALLLWGTIVVLVLAFALRRAWRA
jgi:hypothetical protein